MVDCDKHMDDIKSQKSQIGLDFDEEDEDRDEDPMDEANEFELELPELPAFIKDVPTAKNNDFDCFNVHYNTSESSSNIKKIFHDLIVGALESAFTNFEAKLSSQQIPQLGGCCAIFCVVINGELFVANLGDSRCLIVHPDGHTKYMSTDHRPLLEKERILRYFAKSPPTQSKSYYHDVIFIRGRPKTKGSHLCMAPHRKGLIYREITNENIHKMPIIQRGRLFDQLAVSRSFGDYDVANEITGQKMKPVLSCVPDVKAITLNWYKEVFIPSNDEDVFVYNEEKNDNVYETVMVIASDGLWDCMNA